MFYGTWPRIAQVLTEVLLVVHGYSLLRTQLNNDYFHDIFNEAEKFDINIEAHRMCIFDLAFSMW